MRTIEYLFDPSYAPLYLPGVFSALLIGVLVAPLSVLVVLKRLSFMGQGVSHAAFGGVGVALVLSALIGGTQTAGFGVDAMVLVFALGAAGMMAWLTARGKAESDTAIGVVLAVCMALGFVLHTYAGELAAKAGRPAPPSLESVLFGAIFQVGLADTVIAAVVCVGVLIAFGAFRRPLLFWAFDETVSSVHGVHGFAMRSLLLFFLTLAVIATMKLAGIVLATALLVLPGAAALRLSNRLAPVFLLSTLISVIGVVVGIVVSFELDWATGPSIVGVLATVYGASLILGGAGRAPVPA